MLTADPESLPTDSTAIRAHQHSAGAVKRGERRSGAWPLAWRFGTKVHIAVDAPGNPIRLILAGGQVADVPRGAALIANIGVGYVIADKGHDSNKLVEAAGAIGAEAVITL